MLDRADGVHHHPHMENAADILAALRERGVTQKQIARVLGVRQPNAATLYTPGKNGSTRKLGYDEAIKLIREFGLVAAHEPTLPSPEPWLPSEETLAQLMAFAMNVAPEDDGKLEELRDCATGIATGLRWLAKDPANADDPGFLKAVRIAVTEAIELARSSSSQSA